MKKITISIIMLLILVSTADAQFTINGIGKSAGNDISYTWSGVADSTDTLGFGNAISIANYNGSLTTSPICAAKILTSVAGEPFVYIIIYGSNDGVTYFPVDTLMNKDSVETINTTTLDLNGLGVQYIKPYIYGSTGSTANRSDTVLGTTEFI